MKLSEHLRMRVTIEQFQGFRKVAFQTKPSLRFQTGIIVRRGNPLPTH